MRQGFILRWVSLSFSLPTPSVRSVPNGYGSFDRYGNNNFNDTVAQTSSFNHNAVVSSIFLFPLSYYFYLSCFCFTKFC